MPNQLGEFTDEELFGVPPSDNPVLQLYGNEQERNGVPPSLGPLPGIVNANSNQPAGPQAGELTDADVFGAEDPEPAAKTGTASQYKSGFVQDFMRYPNAAVSGLDRAGRAVGDLLLRGTDAVSQIPGIPSPKMVATAIGQEPAYNKARSELGQIFSSKNPDIVPLGDRAGNVGISDQLVSGVSQAAAAYATGAGVVGEVPAAVAPFAPLIKGGIGDFLGWSGDQPNLSNLANDTLGTNLPTAIQPGDSELEGRAKNVIEGGIFGQTLDVVLRGAGGLYRRLTAAKGRVPTIDDVKEAAAAGDPEASAALNDPDLKAAAEANGITDPADPRVAQLQERLAARRQVEEQKAAVPPTEPGQMDFAQLNRERADVGDGVIDPGAQRITNAERPRVPADQPLPVTPEGQVKTGLPQETGINAGMRNADRVRTEVDANAAAAFDSADVQRRRGPEYEATRAIKEAEFASAESYGRLSERIKEDPATVAEQQLSIPPATFKALPPDAQERIIAAAQRQRSATKPGDTVFRSSDAAESGTPPERYSPASRPVPDAAANRNFAQTEDRTAAKQPTDTELASTNRSYGRSAAGNSDRPFKADDSAGASPDQSRIFEDTARAKAADARAASIDDLERAWEARRNAKDSTGKGRFYDAEQKYKAGTARDSFTNTPGKRDAGNRYPVDDYGFVRSSKGGPVRFGDQRMAARWIINEGHKQSPDQIFEIENHPSGKGFTVRERGRSEAASGTKQQGAGTPGGNNQPAGSPSEPRRLPQSRQVPDGEAGAVISKDAAPAASNSNIGDKLNDEPRPETAGKAETVADARSIPAEGERAAGKSATEPPPAKEQDLAGEPSKPAASKPDVPEEELDTDPSRETAGQAPDPEARMAELEREYDRPETTPERKAAIEDEMDSLADQRVEAIKKGGTKLYSNPLDPEAIREHLGEPVMKMLRKEIAEFKRQRKLDQKARGIDDSIKQPSFKEKAQNTAAQFILPVRDTTRMIANRYDDIPEAGKITDMLASDPGSGRHIPETFTEVVQRRPTARFNQVANILGDKVDDEEFASGLRDVLTGERKAKPGEEKIARRLKTLLAEEKKYAEDAGLEFGYQDNYFPRIVNTDYVMSNPEKSMTAVENYVRKTFGLSKDEAKQEARDWFNRETGITQDRNAVAGTVGSFTKGRKWPASADKALKELYITDPVEALSNYFNGTTRAAEYVRRFGPDGELAKYLVDEKVKSGASRSEIADFKERIENTNDVSNLAFEQMREKGMTPEDETILRKNFMLMTGRPTWKSGDLTKWDRSMMRAADWVQAMGTFQLLDRAVVRSLLEPLTYGARTGSLHDSLKGLMDSFGYVLGAKGDKEDVKLLAEMMGSISDAFHHQIQQSRVGVDVGNAYTRRTMANFFEMTGLHGLTENQVLTGIPLGNVYMRKLLKDSTGGDYQTMAKADLNNLGIGEKDIPGFTKWLSDQDKNPTDNGLWAQDANARMYQNAMNRFITESIQSPGVADRPYLATHPYGKMVYGITGFTWSFTRKVLLQNMKKLGQAVKGETGAGAKLNSKERAAMAYKAAAPLAVLIASQAALNHAYTKLTNPDRADEMTAWEKAMADLSASGSFGYADPFINMATGVRYGKDLTSMTAGAQLGWFLGNVMKIATAFTPENSPNTNSAEYNATQAAYNLAAAPAITSAILKYAKSPILKFLAGAAMVGYLGSPQRGKDAATAIVGPKDTNKNKSNASPDARPSGRTTRPSTRGQRSENDDTMRKSIATISNYLTAPRSVIRDPQTGKVTGMQVMQTASNDIDENADPAEMLQKLVETLGKNRSVVRDKATGKLIGSTIENA